MHPVQLPSVDANLFVLLDAMLEERSVLKAARRLGLSPSAASHALARLRTMLSDELFIRGKTGFELTPRAQALVEPTKRLIGEMKAMLEVPGKLAPGRLKRRFRIATSDHIGFVLLHRLEERLTREAPFVDIDIRPLGPRTLTELEEGTLDLALGVWDQLPSSFGLRPLFTDRLVSFVRRGHPAARGQVSLRSFARLNHVLVAPYGLQGGPVDDLLTRQGLSRRVARVLPTFLEAPFLVSRTDYVVTLPHAFIGPLARLLRLRQLQITTRLPEFTVSVAWHRRLDGDAAHAWLLGLIATVAGGEMVSKGGASQSGPRSRSRRGSRSA